MRSVISALASDEAVDGLTGLTVLDLSDERIEVVSKIITIQCPWKQARGLTSRDSHDFLELTPLQSIAIPASAFRSEDERLAFQSQVKRHVEPQEKVRGHHYPSAPKSGSTRSSVVR